MHYQVEGFVRVQGGGRVHSLALDGSKPLSRCQCAQAASEQAVGRALKFRLRVKLRNEGAFAGAEHIVLRVWIGMFGLNR